MTAKHLTSKNRVPFDTQEGPKVLPAKQPRGSRGRDTLNRLAGLAIISLILAAGLAWIYGTQLRQSPFLAIAYEQVQDAAPISATVTALVKEADEPHAEVVEKRPQIAAEAAAVASPSPTTAAEVPANISSPSLEPGSKHIQQSRLTRSEQPYPDDRQPESLTISGQVRDEDGQRLPGIEVAATAIRLFNTGAETANSTPPEERTARTDYEGVFEFPGIEDGEYRIHTAAMDGFAPAQIVVRAGSTSANLELSGQREVQVYCIVSSVNGTPLEAVQILSVGHTSFSGPKGLYEVIIAARQRDWPPTIRFRRDGYRDELMQLDDNDPFGAFDEVLLDVFMEPLTELTTVTGSLQGSDGRAVVGEELHLQPLKLKTQYRTLSDQNGRFSFRNVQPGNDYQVRIFPKSDYRDYKRLGLKIPNSGLKLEVELAALGLGRFSGWMMNLDGNPIPDFTLTLRSQANVHHSVQVTGDDEGFFEVEGIPKGGLRLRSESLPKITVSGMRTLPEGGEPVPIFLDLGLYELIPTA